MQGREGTRHPSIIRKESKAPCLLANGVSSEVLDMALVKLCIKRKSGGEGFQQGANRRR